MAHFQKMSAYLEALYLSGFHISDPGRALLALLGRSTKADIVLSVSDVPALSALVGLSADTFLPALKAASNAGWLSPLVLGEDGALHATLTLPEGAQ